MGCKSSYELPPLKHYLPPPTFPFYPLYQSILPFFYASTSYSLTNILQNLDFAFLELCQRPEYLDPIRKEIANTATLDVNTISNEMLILDSFLKESMRLNPMDDRKLSPLPITITHITHPPPPTPIILAPS